MKKLSKAEAIKRVKAHMEWVASIDIESMTPERKADQCYGLLQGMEMALGLEYDDGKLWDELTEYWNDLWARIYGFKK